MRKCIQCIPRMLHTIHVWLWIGAGPFYPYPSGLLHWHWDYHLIAPVPVKQPWRIWVNVTYKSINDWWYNQIKVHENHLHIWWKTLCGTKKSPIFYGTSIWNRTFLGPPYVYSIEPYLYWTYLSLYTISYFRDGPLGTCHAERSFVWQPHVCYHWQSLMPGACGYYGCGFWLKLWDYKVWIDLLIHVCHKRNWSGMISSK